MTTVLSTPGVAHGGCGKASSSVTELISRGAGLNGQDDLHRTPLHMAVYGNALQAAAELVARSANLHATDLCGRTPGNLAEKLGRSELLALLTHRKTT